MQTSLAPVLLTILVAAGPAQDPATPDRAHQDRLERLERQVEALGSDLEQARLGDLAAPLGRGRHGLGPAASKVYELSSGTSIAGYGELLFSEVNGATDVADALRAVLFVGHRFDERWVLNSEIEFEHGTTDASSGTTGSGGSASLEFGYIDYLALPELSFRAGLVLAPIGLVNEEHEPTLYLPARRSETETRIIPTTWRELGVGLFGEAAGFAYRAYLTNSLDGDDFAASGVRGGRQKGNRAAADDLAGMARLDWVGVEGLVIGASVFTGRTGQDQRAGAARIGALHTTIADVHVDARVGVLRLRGLAATAYIDGAGAFSAATGRALARRMDGGYLEAGVDLLGPLGVDAPDQELLALARWEYVDSHAEPGRGVARDRSQRDRILTFGLHYKPRPQVVLKLDFEDWTDGDDRWNAALGYVF